MVVFNRNVLNVILFLQCDLSHTYMCEFVARKCSQVWTLIVTQAHNKNYYLVQLLRVYCHRESTISSTQNIYSQGFLRANATCAIMFLLQMANRIHMFKQINVDLGEGHRKILPLWTKRFYKCSLSGTKISSRTIFKK